MATGTRSAADGSTWARSKPLFLAAFLAILSFFGLELVLRLSDILILLFISLVLAAALSRPSAVLERRGIPRGLAVTIVQLVVLAVLLVVGWVVIPPLIDQLAAFADRVPSYVDRFQALRKDYAKIQARYPELGSFDSAVSKLADRFGNGVGTRLIDLPIRTAEILFQLLTILALSTLMVLRRERFIRAVLALVSPERRPQVEEVFDKIWERIGAYVRAKLIVMTIVGVLMYVCLLALDVPFAVPLAVIVAFGEVIPQIGPWIGRIPLLSVAAFQGPETLVLTFLASFVIENLKAYVISPKVEGDQLKLDPLLVLIAVLVGGALLGAAGALVSVPFAAMLQVLWDEIVVPWRLDQIDDQEEAVQPAAPG
jgi:predicted PurR-regulated permease PerM